MAATENAGNSPAGSSDEDCVYLPAIYDRIGPLRDLVANLRATEAAAKARVIAIITAMKDELHDVDACVHRVVACMKKAEEARRETLVKTQEVKNLREAKEDLTKRRVGTQTNLDQFLHARKLTEEAWVVLKADLETLVPERDSIIVNLEKAKKRNEAYLEEVNELEAEVRAVESKVSKLKTAFELMKGFCSTSTDTGAEFPDLSFLDDYKTVSILALSSWITGAREKQRRRSLAGSLELRSSPGSSVWGRSGLFESEDESNERESKRDEVGTDFSSSSEEEKTEEKLVEQQSPVVQRGRLASLRSSNQISTGLSKKSEIGGNRKPPSQKKSQPASRGQRGGKTPARRIQPARKAQKKPVVAASDVSSKKKAQPTEPLVESVVSSEEEEDQVKAKPTPVAKKRTPVAAPIGKEEKVSQKKKLQSKESVVESLDSSEEEVQAKAGPSVKAKPTPVAKKSKPIVDSTESSASTSSDSSEEEEEADSSEEEEEATKKTASTNQEAEWFSSLSESSDEEEKASQLVAEKEQEKREASTLTSDSSETGKFVAKRKPPAKQPTRLTATPEEKSVLSSTDSSEEESPAAKKKLPDKIQTKPLDSSSEEEKATVSPGVKLRRSPRKKPSPQTSKPTKGKKAQPKEKKGKMWSQSLTDWSLAFSEDADLAAALSDDGDDEPDLLQHQGGQQQPQSGIQNDNSTITVNVSNDLGIGAVFGDDLNASSLTSMPDLDDIFSSIEDDGNVGPVVAQIKQDIQPTPLQVDVAQQQAVTVPIRQSSFDLNVDNNVVAAGHVPSPPGGIQQQHFKQPSPSRPLVQEFSSVPTSLGKTPTPASLRRSPRIQKANGLHPSPVETLSGPKKENKRSLFGLSSSDEDDEKPPPPPVVLPSPSHVTPQRPAAATTSRIRTLSESSTDDEDEHRPSHPTSSLLHKAVGAAQQPPTPDKTCPLSSAAIAEATKRRRSSPSPASPARASSSSSSSSGVPSPASSTSYSSSRSPSPAPHPPQVSGLPGRPVGSRTRTMSRGEGPAPPATRGRGGSLAAARQSGRRAQVKEVPSESPNWKRSFECRTRNAGGESQRLAKMLTGPGGFDVAAALDKKLHGPKPMEVSPRAVGPSAGVMAGPLHGPGLGPRFQPPRPPGPGSMNYPRPPPMPRHPPIQGHARGRPPRPPLHRPPTPSPALMEDPFVRKSSRSRIVPRHQQRSGGEEPETGKVGEPQKAKQQNVTPVQSRTATPPSPLRGGPPICATPPLKQPANNAATPASVLQRDLSLSDTDSEEEEEQKGAMKKEMRASPVATPRKPPHRAPSPASSVSSSAGSMSGSEMMTSALREIWGDNPPKPRKRGRKPKSAQSTSAVCPQKERTPTPTRMAKVNVGSGISFQFPVEPGVEAGPAGLTNGKVEDSEDEGRLVLNVDGEESSGTAKDGSTGGSDMSGGSNGLKRKASSSPVKVDARKEKKSKMADVFGDISSDEEETGVGLVKGEEEVHKEDAGPAGRAQIQLPLNIPTGSQGSSDEEGRWVIAEASEEDTPKTPLVPSAVPVSGTSGAFITFPAMPQQEETVQKSPVLQFYMKPADAPVEVSGGAQISDIGLEGKTPEGKLLRVFQVYAGGQYPMGMDFDKAKEVIWANLGSPLFTETLAKALKEIESDMMLNCQLVVKYDASLYPPRVFNLARGFLSFNLPAEDIHERVVFRLLHEQQPAVERAVNVNSVLAFILICSYFWPFPPKLLKEFFLYALQSKAWKIGHTVMCLKIMAASGAANDKFLKTICGHLSARRLRTSVCIGCSSLKGARCQFLWDIEKEFGDFPLSILQAVSFKRLAPAERKLVGGILGAVKQEAQMTQKEKKGWELIECLMFREA